MNTSLMISTGARLHFGLFDTTNSRGRQGGIGVMVDAPTWELGMSESDRDQVVADSPIVRDRVAKRLTQIAGSDSERSGIRIDVIDAIPGHRGLGSGTQLSLALHALVAQSGCVNTMAPAEDLGRGSRSLVGSLGFQHGGMVIDPGEVSVSSGVSEPLVERLPDSWRFVIFRPLDDDGGGVCGEVEEKAFNDLAPMSDSVLEQLRRLAFRQIVPGVQQGSFVDFAAGLAEFNRLIGEQFAPAQGGVYAHPLLQEVANDLQRTPWAHVAQSSWGPAGVVFCPTPASAEELSQYWLAGGWNDRMSWQTASPLNQPAQIQQVVPK